MVMKNQTVTSQNEYHVVDILGEGAPSTVYKAIKRDRSESIQTEVALKVFSSEEHIGVWKREFSSLLGVSSPFCVKVFSFEWAMNKPALCLELVEGLTLVELLDSQSLEERDIIEISAQALMGLQDLWSSGLYHGDLSPMNVMVANDGQVKLLDFGLGNFDDKVRRGTPFFVHDSLINGGAPSKESDLFSLGRLINWSGQRVRHGNRDLHELGTQVAVEAEVTPDKAEQLQPSPVGKARLAEIVTSKLSEKRSAQPQTEEFMVQAESFDYVTQKESQDIGPSAQIDWRRIALRLGISASLATLFAVFVLQIGKLPEKLSASKVSKTPATLQIRTKSWREIWIDGKRSGYTPATLKGLTPGKHILKWASPEGSGEMILTLQPGENKLLNDNDLDSPGVE